MMSIKSVKQETYSKKKENYIHGEYFNDIFVPYRRITDYFRNKSQKVIFYINKRNERGEHIFVLPGGIDALKEDVYEYFRINRGLYGL